MSAASAHVGHAVEPAKRIRAGIIGVDTSHAVEFTKLLSNPKATGEILFTIMGPGCNTVARVAPDKVVGLWKGGRQGIFIAKGDLGA